MPKGNPMGYLKKGAKNRVPVKKKKSRATKKKLPGPLTKGRVRKQQTKPCSS